MVIAVASQHCKCHSPENLLYTAFAYTKSLCMIGCCKTCPFFLNFTELYLNLRIYIFVYFCIYILYFDDKINDIWKQIEDIIIKSLITVAKENYQEISINKNNSLFELYGYDILIDESFRAWLIEVNINPSLHCTSPLDLSIKTDLVSDIFNIIGIIITAMVNLSFKNYIL